MDIRSSRWWLVASVIVCCGIAMAAAAARAQGRAAAAPSLTLWLFFSPTSGDLSKDLEVTAVILKKRPDVRFRPCLIAAGFDGIAKPDARFASTVKAISAIPSPTGSDPGLRIMDEEGLATARRLGIGALPAWAYINEAGTAHLAIGRGANLGGLLSCK